MGGLKRQGVFTRLMVILAVVLVFCVAIGVSYVVTKANTGPSIYVFEGLVGPQEKSVVAPAVETRHEEFSDGSESRLAILLTEQESNWLGVAHGLKSIGIPFVITTDYRLALKHKVVFVYPMISGRVLSKDALQALAKFPREGGTLIAQNVFGGGLNEVFGFGEAVMVKNEMKLKLYPGQAITTGFQEPEEQTFPIASSGVANIGTFAFTQAGANPVAVYEDGKVAITQKFYENGRAYAFGFDLGHLLLKGYNNRQEEISGHFANYFSPTLDVLLRLIKKIYTEGETSSVTLGTVPFGKSLSVIFTHDVDYWKSMKNALVFAAFEKSQDIKGTYFIQTKYVRDWNDQIFFDDKGAQIVKQLQELGAEIGSHSVAHSRVFEEFDLGDGSETYPSYVPFVRSKTTCENASILGELRVSRFLLENFMEGKRLVSFRPGHLRNPFRLPEALLAAGYKYSSSATANNSMTHLPFRLNYGRSSSSETPIFEFPITIEDELDAPMLKRLPQALELARKLQKYGGLFNILIHPDELGQKLEFEQKFAAAIGKTAWYGSIEEFGDWWRARDQVAIDVTSSRNRVTVNLEAKEAISGLTLELPAGFKLADEQPSKLTLSQQKNQVVIERLAGRAQLLLSAI